MNKKIIISSLVFLGLLIIFLITWLYLQNSSSNIPPLSITPNPVTTATLPSVTKQSSEQTAPVKQSQEYLEKKDSVIIENFSWSRILFFNENDASKRLQSYFDRTSLDQQIILDKCDLVRDQSCSTDFKSVIKICKLSGEDWSYLPLVFDRTTNTCYTSYADIVDYLNKVREQNK